GARLTQGFKRLRGHPSFGVGVGGELADLLAKGQEIGRRTEHYLDGAAGQLETLLLRDDFGPRQSFAPSNGARDRSHACGESAQELELVDLARRGEQEEHALPWILHPGEQRFLYAPAHLRCFADPDAPRPTEEGERPERPREGLRLERVSLQPLELGAFRFRPGAARPDELLAQEVVAPRGQHDRRKTGRRASEHLLGLARRHDRAARFPRALPLGSYHPCTVRLTIWSANFWITSFLPSVSVFAGSVPTGTTLYVVLTERASSFQTSRFLIMSRKEICTVSTISYSVARSVEVYPNTWFLYATTVPRSTASASRSWTIRRWRSARKPATRPWVISSARPNSTVLLTKTGIASVLRCEGRALRTV